MKLNPFRSRPPSRDNVIQAGEGWYRWRWLRWRRLNCWRRGARWFNRGKLEQLK